MIVCEGRDYVLRTHDGRRVLGRHPSRAAALAQERAVWAGKQRRRGNPAESLAEIAAALVADGVRLTPGAAVALTAAEDDGAVLTLEADDFPLDMPRWVVRAEWPRPRRPPPPVDAALRAVGFWSYACGEYGLAIPRRRPPPGHRLSDPRVAIGRAARANPAAALWRRANPAGDAELPVVLFRATPDEALRAHPGAFGPAFARAAALGALALAGVLDDPGVAASVRRARGVPAAALRICGTPECAAVAAATRGRSLISAADLARLPPALRPALQEAVFAVWDATDDPFALAATLVPYAPRNAGARYALVAALVAAAAPAAAGPHAASVAERVALARRLAAAPRLDLAQVQALRDALATPGFDAFRMAVLRRDQSPAERRAGAVLRAAGDAVYGDLHGVTSALVGAHRAFDPEAALDVDALAARAAVGALLKRVAAAPELVPG